MAETFTETQSTSGRANSDSTAAKRLPASSTPSTASPRRLRFGRPSSAARRRPSDRGWAG